LKLNSQWAELALGRRLMMDGVQGRKLRILYMLYKVAGSYSTPNFSPKLNNLEVLA
jgi:hypothetical protein